MKLVVDCRDGVGNLDRVIDPCTVEQAIYELDRLDGMRHTLLALERGDEWQLCVGGGAKKFVVTLSSSGDENYTLSNPAVGAGEVVELCAGGQFGEFPEDIVVCRLQAASAVLSFFDGKEFSLSWEV